MRSLFAGLLVLAALAAAGCAPMGMSATMQIRSAPPPPNFQFSGDPQFNYLSHRRVAVIADDSFGYDMFSLSGSYYVYSGGYWYRSPSPRGPFVVVETRRVPRQIFEVSDQDYRWRSHPEGWRGGRGNGNQRPGEGNRGNGRGNGR